MSCRSSSIRCGIALVLAIGFAPYAEACNTPVYRYAMDNWAPAPFEVYYFYRQKIAKEDEAVHRMLKDLSAGRSATVNLMLATIDVAKPRELDQVPAPVRESWKSKHGSALSNYLIWSPWGAEVFAGRLDQAAVREMVDSPVRTRLGELLRQGNAVVLLILASPNEAENQRAQAAAKEVISRGAGGKIPVAGVATDPLAGSPTDPPGSKPAGDEDQPRDSSRLELAQLAVSRSDPKERWLIRMLLAVEPDLPQFVDEPMIFGVYGRGRAMEPFVGKGITADNLTELMVFLAGACSCQVKDRNPGADLLFHWDWNATADFLAAADPGRTGNQPAYQEFAADAMGEKTSTVAKRTSTEVETARPSQPVGKPAVAGNSIPAPQEKPAPDGSLGKNPAAPQAMPAPAVNPADTTVANRPEEGAQAIALPKNLGYDADGKIWKYGMVFALATMLVLVAGLVLLRRHSP